MVRISISVACLILCFSMNSSFLASHSFLYYPRLSFHCAGWGLVQGRCPWFVPNSSLTGRSFPLLRPRQCLAACSASLQTMQHLTPQYLQNSSSKHWCWCAEMADLYEDVWWGFTSTIALLAFSWMYLWLLIDVYFFSYRWIFEACSSSGSSRVSWWMWL